MIIIRKSKIQISINGFTGTALPKSKAALTNRVL